MRNEVLYQYWQKKECIASTSLLKPCSIAYICEGDIRYMLKYQTDFYNLLEVTPMPDTVIRVYMDFKALDEKIEVKLSPRDVKVVQL